MNLNIFKTLNEVKDLQAEKKSLLERLERTEKELNEAQDVIGDFMVEQKTFDTKIAEVEAKSAAKIEEIKKEYEAKLAELQASTSVQINNLEKTVKEEQESAVQKAAEIVASIGVEPDAVKVTTDDVVCKTGKKSRFSFYTKPSQ